MNSVKTIVALIGMISCFGCATLVLDDSPHDAKGKVTVCHKDKKTISVDESAVKAHLGHGDYLGVCR